MIAWNLMGGAEPKPPAERTLPEHKEGPMKRTLLPFCLLLVAMISQSAFAQSARGTPAFYIVLDALTKRCSVVDKTPKTDTPNLTVANDTIYPTREEAEKAIETLPACKG
jgi:hypothetical protein